MSSEVVHQPRLSPRVAINDVGRVSHAVRLRFPPEDLRPGEYRGQRRPQLMRQDGEEPVLRSESFRESLRALLECRRPMGLAEDGVSKRRGQTPPMADDTGRPVRALSAAGRAFLNDAGVVTVSAAPGSAFHYLRTATR
jgi:hypothetical protein